MVGRSAPHFVEPAHQLAVPQITQQTREDGNAYLLRVRVQVPVVGKPPHAVNSSRRLSEYCNRCGFKPGPQFIVHLSFPLLRRPERVAERDASAELQLAEEHGAEARRIVETNFTGAASVLVPHRAAATTAVADSGRGNLVARAVSSTRPRSLTKMSTAESGV